jgi:hypothetical protein
MASVNIRMACPLEFCLHRFINAALNPLRGRSRHRTPPATGYNIVIADVNGYRIGILGNVSKEPFP